MNTKRVIVGFDTEGNHRLTEDVVADETRLRLYVNGTLAQDFECSPIDLEELALGYLFVNGIINDRSQIVENNGVQVRKGGSIGQYEIQIVIQPNKEPRDCKEVPYPVERDPRGMMQCEATLLEASEAFRQTGCIHAAGLFEQMTMRYLGEDISRYYAMYKVIGKAWKDGRKLSDFCLCTTGRLPLGYMERVVRAGISCVVSRSAPTHAALSLAEQYGVLTFGFAGGKRINLYPTLTGCAILAGGKAKRMKGRDKSKLPVEGQTMRKRIIEQLPEDKALYVSFNRPKEEITEIKRAYKLVRDHVEGIGPLGGIYTVLQEAGKDGCVKLLITACDTPWYNTVIANTLLQEADAQSDVVVVRTRDNQVHPLCGVYRISCLPVIEQMIKEENYKLQLLLDRVQTKYLSAEKFGLEEKWFTNVNTEEEYEKITKR